MEALFYNILCQFISGGIGFFFLIWFIAFACCLAWTWLNLSTFYEVMRSPEYRDHLGGFFFFVMTLISTFLYIGTYVYCLWENPKCDEELIIFLATLIYVGVLFLILVIGDAAVRSDTYEAHRRRENMRKFIK